MAEMYIESGAGYDLRELEDGIDGTRVFIRDDNGGTIAAGSLPEVGVGVMVRQNGTTEVEGCLLRERRFSFVNGHSGTQQVVCTYSTKPMGYRRAGDAVTNDYQAASFDLGISQDTIRPDPNPADGDYWTWGSSEEVDQELPITLPTGRIEITYPFDVPEDDRDALLSRVNAFQGKINDDAFWGRDAGQVRFMGISGGGTFRDKENAVFYRVSFLFEIRVLPASLKATGADTKDWLYVFSAKHGKYKKPFTNVGGKYLYDEADFDELLSELED